MPSLACARIISKNTYEGKFGMADAEYTELVDKGRYTNFVRDSAG